YDAARWGDVTRGGEEVTRGGGDGRRGKGVGFRSVGEVGRRLAGEGAEWRGGGGEGRVGKCRERRGGGRGRGAHALPVAAITALTLVSAGMVLARSVVAVCRLEARIAGVTLQAGKVYRAAMRSVEAAVSR
ncbi:MAG: hypothetical protein ACXVDI_21625, partial [Ktedonobacterales bacterium]